MKKAYTIICHLCLYAMLALSACSCTQDESFLFRGASGISFERASYRLAMGSLPYSVADTVIRIPLTAVGSAILYRADITCWRNKRHAPHKDSS